MITAPPSSTPPTSASVRESRWRRIAPVRIWVSGIESGEVGGRVVVRSGAEAEPADILSIGGREGETAFSDGFSLDAGGGAVKAAAAPVVPGDEVVSVGLVSGCDGFSSGAAFTSRKTPSSSSRASGTSRTVPTTGSPRSVGALTTTAAQAGSFGGGWTRSCIWYSTHVP